MSLKTIDQFFKPEGGPEIRIRSAKADDARRIQVLYTEIYGANYPIQIVFDAALMRKAIESSHYFWLVGEHNGRIIASLIYEISAEQRLAKALGAVVSRDYRKHNLANTMMKLILDKITKEEQLVDVVYATTRTVSTAPQQMTRTMGFVPLGIFPNAHKVFEHETHCLSAYYLPQAWKERKTPVRLLKNAAPFFWLTAKGLAKKGLEPGKPKIDRVNYGSSAGSRKPTPETSLINFELVRAPNFALERFKKFGNAGVFSNWYVPFHQPNLLLISTDQKTEIYVHHGERDRYAVITGGRSELSNLSLILNSASQALLGLNVSYIETLVDAYSPELQWQAMHARFLPSAYFPAMRRVGKKRWDYIVFSRSFDMLDFRNVTLMPAYRGFLREYLKIWQELYIDSAFSGRKK